MVQIQSRALLALYPAWVSGFFRLHFLATVLGYELGEARSLRRADSNNNNMEHPEVICVANDNFFLLCKYRFATFLFHVILNQSSVAKVHPTLAVDSSVLHANCFAMLLTG